MPIKDQYLSTKRNSTIRQQFQHLLAQGVPRMKAYVALAEKFYLSPNRIRYILSAK